MTWKSIGMGPWSLGFLLLLLATVSSQPASIDLGDLLGGGNQDCPGACENGAYPVPQARLRPYSNGCSVPPALRQGLGDYSQFEPCCDLHDACYQACGISKALCESEFRRCMKRQCAQDTECSSLADLFAMGTTMFGCQGYVELQKDACECVDNAAQAVERVHTYAKQFYAAFNKTHELPASTENFLHQGKHGELLFRLYRKYPSSIHMITRDGTSSRAEKEYFSVEQ